MAESSLDPSSLASSVMSASPCSCSTPSTYCLENPREAIEKGFHLVPKPKFEEGFQLFHVTINNKIESVYNAAKAAYADGSYNLCLSHISKALFLDPNNVRYYILGGDAYLSKKDFKSAILYYKRVCILKPEKENYYAKLSHIYYLQGETYFSKKLYLDALECFTRASEMKPDNSEYHERSIACLASLNRHKECLNFINKRLTVEPKNVKLLIFRAKLHLLFCNPTLAYFDVIETLNVDAMNAEANQMLNNLEVTAESCKEKAQNLDISGKLKEAILKISQAIATNPSVTEYHVLRASMHRRNNDFNASVDDLLLTMDKVNHDPADPIFKNAQKQLLLAFNDFAVLCFQKGFYEEAIVLLEKAIKGEKEDRSLYCNRGDCFLKLNHLHFALLDYQQAQELDPFDKGISLRLSIVYNELGILEYKDRKYYKAEDYFSLAISHNPNVSTYYVSRARARYMGEKLVEAQIDMISALYLDRNNKEVSSMFPRLFPGKSIDDVLNGELGCLVIDALECELKDSEIKCKIKGSLNKLSPLNDIDKRSSVDAQLQKCMEDQEFDFSIIKGKKMVNDLVASVIQSKQDLTYQGPSVSSNILQSKIPDSAYWTK